MKTVLCVLLVCGLGLFSGCERGNTPADARSKPANTAADKAAADKPTAPEKAALGEKCGKPEDCAMGLSCHSERFECFDPSVPVATEAIEPADKAAADKPTAPEKAALGEKCGKPEDCAMGLSCHPERFECFDPSVPVATEAIEPVEPAVDLCPTPRDCELKCPDGGEMVTGREKANDVIIRCEIHGQPHGKYVQWWGNGQKLETGQFKDGKKHGKWVRFGEKSNRVGETGYKDGTLIYARNLEDGRCECFATDEAGCPVGCSKPQQ